MKQQRNKELELAYRFVNETNRHIFLTGRAGTGKTTFLKNLKNATHKRNVVVAPTGVAAINAGGMTIHSLFQLPFGVHIPGDLKRASGERKMRRNKINLLRSIDLLIIDEISMVRADIMDAIDEVLKRYRHNTAPFGGVQLLMIGDLHQLPPVVKNNERDLLRAHYTSEYFFGSNSIRNAHMIIVELHHVYRQSDQNFINLLNKIRTNNLDHQSLNILNERYDPNQKEKGVILTSHRNTSKKINQEKLNELKSPSFSYKAEIDGVFSESSFPNDEKLELKKGAKIMFVKNDLSEVKEYYNGKLGEITDLNNKSITVKADDGMVIEVFQTTWENTRYELNEKFKILEENVIGSFTQFPIKLAWAITIHKSQGLTFDQVVIDAQDAFAHGQVYVALSRCRTLEGITLLSKIDESAVRTDTVVENFDKNSKENAPSEDQLKAAINEYEKFILLELFDFGLMKMLSQSLVTTIAQNANSIIGDTVNEIRVAGEKLYTEAIQITEKFRPQLQYALQDEMSITQNEKMMKRLKGSGKYFFEKLNEEIFILYKNVQIISDNKSVEEKLDKQIDNLKKEIYIKGMTFKALKHGYSSLRVIANRSNAEIDYDKRSNKITVSKSKSELIKEVKHKELYDQLEAWRNYESSKNDESYSKIITLKSMIILSDVMPRSLTNLGLIHGLGKKKIEQYGEIIIKIIDKYCTKYDLEGDYLDLLPKKKKPTEIPFTSKKTVELFKSGKSIEEIAKSRELVVGTIESHLSKGVKWGLININELISEKKLKVAMAYFEKTDNKSLTEARTHLGDHYSYGELRMVTSWMERQKENGDSSE